MISKWREWIILIGLVSIALLMRIYWLEQTNYTAEDAFITFRYAHNLADGAGFVFNPGERVLGTTTPFLALILSGWMRAVNHDIVFAARLISLAAVAGTLIFIWFILFDSGIGLSRQIWVLGLLAVSSLLWEFDTSGMETPLAIFLISASWYFLVRQKSGIAGILFGCLLLTRIDLFLWGICLLVGLVTLKEKVIANSLALAGGCLVVFLPWAVFAQFYFGSIIPFSVMAKYTAYVQFNPSAYTNHFLIVWNSLIPFLGASASKAFNGYLVLLTVALWSTGTYTIRRNKSLMILPLFSILQGALIILTRATYFSWYMIPVTWSVLLIAGIGIGEIWESLKISPKEQQIQRKISSLKDQKHHLTRLVWITLGTGAWSVLLDVLAPGSKYTSVLVPLALGLAAVIIYWLVPVNKRIPDRGFSSTGITIHLPGIGFGILLAGTLFVGWYFGRVPLKQAEMLQQIRYESALMKAGLWLRDNTPRESVVLLEPLGYAGFYSERRMIDEVGLITPAIVEMKKHHILDTYQYMSAFLPDYWFLHCDDAERNLSKKEDPPVVLMEQYRLVAKFDPEIAWNGVNPGADFLKVLKRNSCYVIYEKIRDQD
ncbi:MAG TPA: hypothetical protein VIO61_09890 [Anaerolineaceae bacterium]